MTITDSTLLDSFQDVVIDHDNKEFYRGWLEKKLILPRCRQCGTWQGTLRPICSSCWSFDLEHTPVSGRGTVHLLIWLHQGPPAPGVDYSTPHPVATIELAEQPGLRFTSTVPGATPETLAIGDEVELDWIERYDAPFPVFQKVGGNH